MADWNPWKMTAIGMALVVVTAVVTGLVVANWTGGDKSQSSQPPTAPPSQVSAPPAPPMAAPAPAPPAGTPHVASSAPHAAPRPTAAVVEACNSYAKEQSGDKAVETVKDALIGAAAGAGLGAASGAIAGGGKGAGKGAGIGGVVGAAAGTLYGLNESKSHDARYVQAYRTCMKGRGYTS